MHNQQPREFLCFECVTVADEVVIEEIASVECLRCGTMATLESAVDDCFLFIVYSAVAKTLSGHERPYRFRFMPASENAHRAKASMVASKRAA